MAICMGCLCPLPCSGCREIHLEPRPEYTITERSQSREDRDLGVWRFQVHRILRGKKLHYQCAVTDAFLKHQSYRQVKENLIWMAEREFRKWDDQARRANTYCGGSVLARENEQLRAEKRRQYETIQQLQDKVALLSADVTCLRETVETQQATIRVQDAMLAGQEREKPVFHGSTGHQFQKRDGVVCYRMTGAGLWQTDGAVRRWACEENLRAYRQAAHS